MKIVTRILDMVCKFFKYITALILALMLIASVAEIVRRYILGHSFAWADEFIRYCIVAVAFLGGSVAYRDVGGLVSFDMVQTHLHGKVRLVLELVVNTIVLAFSCYIFYNSIQNLQMPSIVNQISIGLGISMAIPYLPITIGMGVLIILALEKYYIIVCNFRSGVYKKAPAGLPGDGGVGP